MAFDIITHMHKQCVPGAFSSPSYAPGNEAKYVCFSMSHNSLCRHNYDHFTGCSVMDLWNLPTADASILTDVSLLNGSAAQYPNCDAESVGSVVLVNTTLNTATVVYYTGTTPYSRACFVCDESSGYKLNATTKERVCQRNALWSGSAILCGMGCTNYYHRWELLKCCSKCFIHDFIYVVQKDMHK